MGERDQQTQSIKFNNQDYLLLNPKENTELNDLETNYSSLNAEQYIEEEIRNLIVNKPNQEFL